MTRKQIIATVIGICICAAVLLRLTTLHGHPSAGSSQKPASTAEATAAAVAATTTATTTASPGNATPENALRFLGWAAGKGDLELLKDGVTPEIQKMLHSRGGTDMASHAISMGTLLGGAKILDKEVLSDDQVLLSAQPEGKDTPWKVRMQKIGNNWKLAGVEQ